MPTICTPSHHGPSVGHRGWAHGHTDTRPMRASPLVWCPRFLINVINANNRISRVKPTEHRSNLGQPGSPPQKTSPMKRIRTLDQVYAHPWSTLGQRHGQNRLNNWCRRLSSGTFAAFSKIDLNSSKSTFMKVVHLVEGHNFHVDWHFKFWVEIGEKRGQLTVPLVYQNMATFKVGKTFLQNPLRKH
jgi:hypothetical protein